MQKYNHKKVEAKWQKYWEVNKTFVAKDSNKKPKAYILDMFPYPSGAGLHVGHPEGYTATDILSRYSRMKGFNVLHPMGWDAFGLPAENYAIKMGVHPQKTTEKNIKRFTQQIKSIGLSYDWSREVNTSDPEYYKWTQWLFLQLYKKGLAYKKEASVNWCPKDNTVLANEQVVDGCCERCGTVVVKKNLSQWFFKITQYADELLSELDNLDWPEPIKLMQRNWIGRSQGVTWKQKIKDLNIPIECYDSVPQTFMAQTFCVIAPEHPLVKKLVEGTKHEIPVMDFLDALSERRAADRFKVENEIEGIFTGRYIDNPFGTGDLPLWIASFVVADYGTGIVNCSSHDERDFAFAKKFNIPLRPVMFPADPVMAEKVRNLEFCYHHDPEAIMEQPVEFKGRKWGEAREDIIDFVAKNEIGYRTVNYKIRDWLISRQRYWGAPIPIIYCETCKTKKVLLIHGFESSGQGSWIPWMKSELEKQGLEVFAPTLSTAKHPTVESWVEELAPYLKQMGENDIIVGHSLGSKAAVHLLEKTGKKIGNLILVASAMGEMNSRDWGKMSQQMPGADIDSLRKFWESKVNFAKVTKLANNVKLILSKDDQYVQKKTHDSLPKEWQFELWDGFGHFQAKQIPELLKLVLSGLTTGMHPVPEKNLPVKLPTDVDFRPTGESPLHRSKKFKKVVCPQCGGKAERDYDTMDTFVDSSWYFLRYTDPKNKLKFADKKKIAAWLPVDTYIGGAEHAVLHLLYARFFTKALNDLGMLDFREPFVKLRNIGLILGPDGEKMSKSRGNVINPDDIVKEFGADSLRMFEMFIGPLEDAKPWMTTSIVGITRFLDRVWQSLPVINLGSGIQDGPKNDEGLLRVINKATKKITEDIKTQSFNTAVSALMICLNDAKQHLSKFTVSKKVYDEFKFTYIKLLYPFGPHISEELNFVLGGKKSLQLESWPEFDEKLTVDNTAEVVVQVNGKVKVKLTLETGISQEKALASAMELEVIKQGLAGQTIKRTIYVPNRLINFVI